MSDGATIWYLKFRLTKTPEIICPSTGFSNAKEPITCTKKKKSMVMVSRCYLFNGQFFFYFGCFLALKMKFDCSGVAWIINTDLGVRIVLVLANECSFESVHLVGFPMHQNDMRWLEQTNKLARLLIIGVSRKGNVIDRKFHRQLLSGHGSDFFRFGQDMLC